MCLVLLGAVIGNAATATKLQTARTINGTSFNGTANITTVKWGASRNIAISGAVQGNANMDGSGNMNIVTTQANVATVTGSMQLIGTAGSEEYKGNVTGINFPSGFNKDNCVVISIGLNRTENENTGFSFETESSYGNSAAYARGAIGRNVTFRATDNTMILNAYFNSTVPISTTTTIAYTYKIVLMKVS